MTQPLRILTIVSNRLPRTRISCSKPHPTLNRHAMRKVGFPHWSSIPG